MYRYSSIRFNSLLCTRGEIRIGTMHDFRCLEHRKGICDPREGTKVVEHHIPDLFVKDPTDPSYRKSKDFRALEEFQAIKLEATAKNTTLKNITVAREFDEPDCFILCTSKFCSKDTMKQFSGADSCVKILDVTNFYRVLSATLNSRIPVDYKGIYEVKYQIRSEVWNGQDWGLHPAMIKEPIFEQQGELRAIWQPKFYRSIEPIILGNKDLIPFCRMVSM